MKVTNEKTENSQAFLTIEVEPAEMEESLEKSYRRLVKKTKVPGFRVGKAPRTVLERYIGRENLLEEALNELVPYSYGEAIKEQAIEAIARPKFEVTQTEPLVFKAIVPLKPKVNLGDYQNIKVTPQPAVEITENNVDDVLEGLRHQHATWEPVERPVDFGDLVTLDIWSNIEDKPFINQKGAQYQVLKDESFPAPGFSEQLVGMKKEEEKEFKLQFPSDYPRAEQAGKEASFKVRVNEIKQEILPELNDDFAKEINADFKNLAALREQAASDLRRRAEENARGDYEEQVIEAVNAMAQVEFPPVLVEVETDRILNQRFQKGNQEMEEYLKSINKKEDELREELRPLATNNVTRSLVLGKVAEEEKIEVGDSEIDIEIENITKSAAEKKDELKKFLNTPQARQSIGQTLLGRKIVQRLVEIAGGSEEVKTTQKEKKK
ncbi:MAG: trigger factor [Chloroflexota bacterium]